MCQTSSDSCKSWVIQTYDCLSVSSVESSLSVGPSLSEASAADEIPWVEEALTALRRFAIFGCLDALFARTESRSYF
jgi:hypothetical protein